MVFNHLMDEPFRTIANKQQPNPYLAHPKANISENEGEFKIELAVPGLSKEDISIELNQQYLIVASQAKSTTEAEPNAGYYQKEFDYRQFSRTFILPKSVDRELITANCQNGVLTLMLPKKEEAKPQPAKQIQVL